MIVYNDEDKEITIPNGIGNVEVINQVPDMSGYATEQWVEDKKYISEENLKTINGETLVGDGDIKLNVDVDLDGYATEDYVKNNFQEKGNYIVENNIKTINGETIIGSGDIIIKTTSVVKLTQAEYDNITPDDNTIYVITDAEDVNLSQFATQDYVNNLIGDIETILNNIIGA